MHVRTRTWLSFVVIAGLLFMAGSRFGIFDPLENAVLVAVAPVESALQDATRPVADFVNNLTDINSLTNENRSLREENERLLEQLSQSREVEAENQQLQGLLGVRQSPDDTFVAASVFARDQTNTREAIAIDRGSSDGIREGMIVLTQQGSLIGSVSKVLDNYAWVTLITDVDSAVSAVVQESRAPGVVAGAADGSLEMEFVQETAEVSEGDFVLTSGLGGRYPQGEVIGRVVNVERTAQELFQSVRVEPLADLSRIERVLVLESFTPQEEPPP
ncbi:MAG: rod shape-determining protein MreC [Dehalococcoidia bacterium]